MGQRAAPERLYEQGRLGRDGAGEDQPGRRGQPLPLRVLHHGQLRQPRRPVDQGGSGEHLHLPRHAGFGVGKIPSRRLGAAHTALFGLQPRDRESGVQPLQSRRATERRPGHLCHRGRARQCAPDDAAAPHDYQPHPGQRQKRTHWQRSPQTPLLRHRELRLLLCLYPRADERRRDRVVHQRPAPWRLHLQLLAQGRAGETFREGEAVQTQELAHPEGVQLLLPAEEPQFHHRGLPRLRGDPAAQQERCAGHHPAYLLQAVHLAAQLRPAIRHHAHPQAAVFRQCRRPHRRADRAD